MFKSEDWEGEKPYYHVYNRGVEKRNIFLDDNDRKRFLFLLLFLQGDILVDSTARLAKNFSTIGIEALNGFKNGILKNRHIELICFVLMQNHYHLLLRENQDNAVARYTSRLSNSYTKYFNIKNQRSGYLFQNNTQTHLIDSNEYLLNLSAYIHRNSRELKGWKNKEEKYSWSSYQDYVSKNRYGDFLARDVILEQFLSQAEYNNFVKTSPMKAREEDQLFDLTG